jgi:hypothetical protein
MVRESVDMVYPHYSKATLAGLVQSANPD